jgi:hypothetical protein
METAAPRLRVRTRQEAAGVVSAHATAQDLVNHDRATGHWLDDDTPPEPPLSPEDTDGGDDEELTPFEKMSEQLMARYSDQHDHRRHHCRTSRGHAERQEVEICDACQCQLSAGTCPNCGDEPRIRRGQVTSSPTMPEPPLIRFNEKDLAECICRTARARA